MDEDRPALEAAVDVAASSSVTSYSIQDILYASNVYCFAGDATANGFFPSLTTTTTTIDSNTPTPPRFVR